MNDDLMEENKVKNDTEVDRILAFIRDTLAPLKDSEWGARARIAERAGLSEKNLADFANKYGPKRNPQFRTTYKILKGILGRRPVDLEGVKPIITIVGGVQGVPEGLRAEDYYGAPLVEDRIAAGQGQEIPEPRKGE